MIRIPGYLVCWVERIFFGFQYSDIGYINFWQGSSLSFAEFCIRIVQGKNLRILDGGVGGFPRLPIPLVHIPCYHKISK